MKVTVYCASSAKVKKIFFDAAEKLALELVKNDIEIIYGGGAAGLMGKIADTAIINGGKVKGIIPKFMVEVEWAHKNISELVLTQTMSERKEKLINEADALVALPGGTGTLEELLEAITLKRLGLFLKPIIILNTNNYYAPLKEMLEKCVEENFMNESHLSMWKFVDEPEEVVEAIQSTPAWNKDAINFAVVK